MNSQSKTTVEDYIKLYTGQYLEVTRETAQKFPTETGMLFEFIDNWIELIPRDQDVFAQAANSLSGIMLLNFWKLTNWITYEIMSGKYFEAIRDLRFVFEGCISAVVAENAIESVVYEKYQTLSSFSFKLDIFRMWETCRKKQVFRKGRPCIESIQKIVADYVGKSNITDNEAREYIEIYQRILCNPTLYWTMSRMIGECVRYLKLDQADQEKLKGLWRQLSRYQHFSHIYLEALEEDPDFCFLEKMNDKLLRICLDFYFVVSDLFCSVLVWRFPALVNRAQRLCKWWKVNFRRSFTLTEKTIDFQLEQKKSREG